MVIDAGLVRRLIAAQFPEWADLPVSPIVPNGWDNRTFRLGEHMSVRLPSAAAYVAQVEKEHRWLLVLQPHLPLPIPAPLAKGMPALGYPWPWSIYRWIEGETAADDRTTSPIEFARSLAEFLISLHRIDTTDGPAPGQHNFYRGGPLAIYESETRAALSALKGHLDVAAAEKVWTAAVNSHWLRPPVWVHGDIASDNLLVQHGKLCAVIDFGCLAVGDPACDLVIAWTAFNNESRETFRAALCLDDNTWARARGWALWKALITAAGRDNDQRVVQNSRRVIGEILADT